MIKCTILSTGAAMTTATALDLARNAALDQARDRDAETSRRRCLRLRGYRCYDGRGSSDIPVNAAVLDGSVDVRLPS
jgi:hypothetical protein